MTPHSDYYAQDRPDTISEPFKIIPSTPFLYTKSQLLLNDGPLSFLFIPWLCSFLRTEPRHITADLEISITLGRWGASLGRERITKPSTRTARDPEDPSGDRRVCPDLAQGFQTKGLGGRCGYGGELW